MFKKIIVVLALLPLFAFAESVTIEGYNPDAGSSQTSSTSPEQNMMPTQQPAVAGSRQQPNMQNPSNAQMPSNNQPVQQSVQPNNPLPQQPSQPLSQLDIDKWQGFLNSLAACTVGVFDLRQLDVSLAVIYGNTVTDTINSRQGDLCSLTVSLSKSTGAETPATNAKHFDGYECLLSKTTINQMTSYYSRILNTGLPSSTVDPALNSAMDKECKLFLWVNGRKVFQ